MSLSDSSKSKSRPRLLIAEDEEKIAELIKASAESIGFDVIIVNEGDLVLNKVASFDPDVILLDLVMPGLDGIEVLSELSERQCTARIVLMSGMGQSTLTSVQHFATENKLDVAGLLEKPFKMSAIEELLSPLAVPRRASATPADDSVYGNLGLQLRLEPELALTTNGKSQSRRVSASLVWIRDNGEVLSHDQLIAAASSQQSLRGLTSQFLRELANANRQWIRQGLDLGLVIPLPDGFTEDEGLPDFLAQIFRIEEFKPGSITVEISTRALEQNAVITNGILPRLKFKGLNIAIGCSARDKSILSFINNLPIDELIVDVDNLRHYNSADTSETEFQFSSLVSMATKRKIRPTANGVGNDNQLAFAKQCGFTHVRGPAVHKTLLLQEVSEFYQK